MGLEGEWVVHFDGYLDCVAHFALGSDHWLLRRDVAVGELGKVV